MRKQYEEISITLLAVSPSEDILETSDAFIPSGYLFGADAELSEYEEHGRDYPRE